MCSVCVVCTFVFLTLHVVHIILQSEDLEQVVAQLTSNFIRVKELSGSGVRLHFMNSGTAVPTWINSEGNVPGACGNVTKNNCVS